jgi:hypothetical protein
MDDRKKGPGSPDDEEEPQKDAPEGEGEPEDVDDGTPRATRAELDAFLALPETRRRAAGILGAHAPRKLVEELLHDAVNDELAARMPPRIGRMQPWFDKCCRNVAARDYRKRKRRAKYEGEMPSAPVQRDEAGEPIPVEAADPVADPDPSTHPDDDGPRAEGLVFCTWMRHAVADDPSDRQTWEMMEEWADGEDEKKTYLTIALSRGITEAAFKKRAQRLKEKYLPRYRRWRNRAILLLVLGVALVGALVWWIVTRQKPEPTPRPPPLAPIPSASGSPPDTPFEPALPTSPRPAPPAPPPKPGDKPQP